MNLRGISFDVAGFETYEVKGFWVGRVILWGKGNRSLFAVWKDERFTVDILWMRLTQ